METILVFLAVQTLGAIWWAASLTKDIHWLKDNITKTEEVSEKLEGRLRAVEIKVR